LERCYVAETLSGQRATAVEHLGRQNFRTINPILRERRGRVEEYKPVFPGYLFVWLDFDVHRWRAVNGTRGVRGLIRGASSEPIPLPSRVAEELDRRTAAGPWTDIPKIMQGLVEAGMPCRITEGSMMDHVGPCIWEKGERVKIMLAFLGRPIEVELRRDQVEYAGA
jgi:transcriptional antiterminator RfaH